MNDTTQRVPEPRLELSAIGVDGDGRSFGLIDGDHKILANFRFKSAEDALHARQALMQATIAPMATRLAAPNLLARPQTTSSENANQSVRAKAYNLLEEGMSEGGPGRIVEGLLVALIVFNVVAVALESIPTIYAQFHAAFSAFEEISLTAFTVEYVVRLWCSVEDPRIGVLGPLRGRLSFALHPLMLVDFLAFAPSYLGLVFGIDLRVLRIFRLFRLLKLARYSQALQALLGVLAAERSSLFASIILLLSTMCLEGELMHLAEGHIQPQTLGTLPGAMYWAITTLTTVGYGDITPVTPLGKAIAAMTMVTGLALFALPIGIIANGFVTGLSRRRFAVTWSMLRRQPLFQDLDTNALNDILQTATASIIREHAHVTLAGKDADDFYLIVSGTGRAERGEGVLELGPGQMVGEEALHPSTPYSQTVTAQTDMRVLAFPGNELRRLARKYPLIGERVARALAMNDAAYGVDPVQHAAKLDAENQRLRKFIVDGLLEKLVPERSA